MELSSRAKIVNGLSPIDITAGAAYSDYISMKGYYHATAIITFGVSLVGTPAITMTQATEVAGTTTKALGFDWVKKNTDITASDLLVTTAVESDSVTKAATSQQMFVIEIDADSLDADNNYDCFRVNISTPGANATLVGITFILFPRYAGDQPVPSAIID